MAIGCLKALLHKSALWRDTSNCSRGLATAAQVLLEVAVQPRKSFTTGIPCHAF